MVDKAFSSWFMLASSSDVLLLSESMEMRRVSKTAASTAVVRIYSKHGTYIYIKRSGLTTAESKRVNVKDYELGKRGHLCRRSFEIYCAESPK